MSSVKQVRFTGVNGETTQNHEDTSPAVNPKRKTVDLSSLLREPKTENSTERQPATEKRKKKKRKSEFQKLKAEKSKLMKELKKTETSIKEDSERKRNAEYRAFENRQRLARSTSEIHSKVKQLENKISTKEKLRRGKIQKSFKTKIKTTTIKAGKQHGRLIDLTSKLDYLKLDEEQLRHEIYREKSMPSLSAPSTSSCHSNAYEIIPPENEEMETWVKLSNNSKREKERETKDKVHTASDTSTSSPELELYRIGSSLSCETELSTLEEKEAKADKLARKYDFTRELRNTIHQHMISRSYSYSYTNIIPPYKHKRHKPVKTKQSYNRAIYEDKLNVQEFAKKQKKLPVLT
ncbi:uncharacterized protein LOC116290384 [Actinia tenebrosa]|uniref:Uncharacterized protein LOC116290384 n=1 Tax=Actinia tenebrosa TaxID=6105 RepID=A0A6P8H9Z5_ACTTE|nr:uncharacterized protein LOC116290384 [Actinia tenebrosa]